ncbi:MAG: squalene--hopene cyclase [Planctomycetaceae bacterium]|nr:squalene--hopene cyclase [Planctomycetaceae bacterium]MCB9949972.1 squalene--hopene cyclase [Planctomycetaceae bacterium]
MKLRYDPERLKAATQKAVETLLGQQTRQGFWVGRLSTSSLSTATAVMALEQVRQAALRESTWPTTIPAEQQLSQFIERGLIWLSEHQNDDGGWGDTTKSFSNIATTMLAHAVFHATNTTDRFAEVVTKSGEYIERQGGVDAVKARYGKDQTFSVPILTHCALAGLVDWSEVAQLPFELACLPASFYAAIRLPVVSYALPALIAIGQVRFHFRKSWNPFHNWLREVAVARSLRILRRIQPENGGFLEAAPLTSFVVMSLASKGLVNHQVVERGVKFLVNSVLEDGSWPIDTNLSTWVTTLSINALGDDLPEVSKEPLRDWIVGQQYKELHPYTNAAPGGWAWTNLPGGVPDADDTPGALIALTQLEPIASNLTVSSQKLGLNWLLDLQNSDGGWPTFCRGWGNLPFDRSSNDITAHVLRAILSVCPHSDMLEGPDLVEQKEMRRQSPDWPWGRAISAIRRGMDFLARNQRPDGSWLPLWFGNQHDPEEANPTYGTAKVVAAYRDLGRLEALPARDGLRWLRTTQNDDGGWGGAVGTPSTVEETALAMDALLCDPESLDSVQQGLDWLIQRVENDSWTSPNPIGFYFAKLWYFEDLYPVIWTVAALRRALQSSRLVKE